MALHFVDTRGRDGWIRNDLSLEYPGSDHVAESIDGLIDEIESSCGSTEQPLDWLMIELPNERGVWKVERIDGDTE